MKRQFKSAGDFRTSLEARLNRMAQGTDGDIMRLRRQVAFERLLARLGRDSEVEWTLKGGFAMELRFDSARATRDIDLVLNPLSGPSRAINEALAYQHLKQAAALDLFDFTFFEIGPLRKQLEGPIYGGGRFPVTAMMAGRTFVKFAMDIAIAEAPMRPTEIYNGEGLLADYGVHPISIPMISREQQFAEKVHAYVTPRGNRPNSRVKDMIDMAILIADGSMDAERVRAALEHTFAKRDEQVPPQEIPPPPENWEGPFEALAVECELKISLAEAHLQVAAYYFNLSRPVANRVNLPPILG